MSKPTTKPDTKRRIVWGMLCDPFGTTTAEIAVALNCSTNAARQQISALRKAGNKIEVVERHSCFSRSGAESFFNVFRAAGAGQ